MADAGRSTRHRARTTTADGGAAGRCLADLSDDLLRHILFLAPDRDGARTAVLSRRWRWLWRTSGALRIDSRSFKVDAGGGGRRSSSLQQQHHQQLLALRGIPPMPPGFLVGVGAGDHAKTTTKALADKEREAFFRGAEKALAAAHGPLRRLTVSIAEDSKMILRNNLMDSLVSNPALRRVEELHIVVQARETQFTLSFVALPSQALRVLRITRCDALTSSRAFPLLLDLHLQSCSVSLVQFQRIIDAAPMLSKLHLACTHLSAKTSDDDTTTGTTWRWQQQQDAQKLVGRLVMPAVRDIVFARCSYGHGCLELDAPRLQRFAFSKHIEDTGGLSLKSQVIHVDLYLTQDSRAKEGATATRESFWRFMKNFSTVKDLKLSMGRYTMGGLAFTDKASRGELLGGSSFSLLEQLELEVEYSYGFEPLLADLLRCCPILRDLRIKIINLNIMSWLEASRETKPGVHFDKSVSGFRNRRRSRSKASVGRENEDKYHDCGVIPGLTSDQSFHCLQSHLKRVSLNFCMDEPNCLGVKLAKFFVDNAKVLQEIHINDGSHEMLEHLNSSVRRWIASTYNGNNQLNVTG